MAKMFQSVDLNDDGVVTLEELLHSLEAAGVVVGHEIDRARAHVSEKEAARILAFFDRDGQGVLRYNEFMRLLQGTIDVPSTGWDNAPSSPKKAGLADTGLVREVVGLLRERSSS